MNPDLLILLEGLLFILLFGGLPMLRREGLSLQLAVEVLVLTALTLGIALSTGFRLSPVVFLVLLYVVVMRSRVLIDLGNLLSSRGRHQQALTAYRLSMKLWPDVPVRLLALTSYGAVLVRMGALEEAVRILEGVLEQAERLQPKQESACHYNLGVACLRLGQDARAVLEFNQTIDSWPLSPYAQYAKAALKKRQSERGSAQKPASVDAEVDES
ncbi:MAG TPA: tetratricopeptide repeat protein [Anaerolineae bacterium]|jgi:tetratricopeptide (TPR) repeat protein|nr:tetratricopeptide repeat protein [Anaerolineae bacterium]